MFGYITPSRKNLTKEEISKYKSYYCGICHEIGRQYGKKSTFCLSYDMVFLALLLSDLYNEEETRGKEKCAVHPIKEHDYTITKAITYSADVNVILSYYSLLDHVHDDGKEENRLSRIAGYMPSLKEKYPDKIKKLEKQLSILTEREQKVLRLRFGMNDGRARTLEEVGKEFDVTRERIRQIEAKALRKLRHPSRSRKLRDYLD